MPAAAHPQFFAEGQSRYLKLTLVGDGTVRLAYTVMVGASPGRRARQAADANGNGNLELDEQQAMATGLQGEVDRALELKLDGTRRHMRWETPTTGFVGGGAVAPLAFSVDMVGRLLVGHGEHRLYLDDQTVFDGLAETEILLEEGPSAKLLAAWRGVEDGKKQVRFLFVGPKRSTLEDRSIGLRFIDKHRPRRRPLPFVGLGIGAAALIAVSMLSRWGTNSRRSSTTRKSGQDERISDTE